MDWTRLKQDYIFGSQDSVSSFLASLNIKTNGNVGRITKGWREERNEYQKQLELEIQEKTIRTVSDTESQVRARQARIAKDLQIKANKYLRENAFNNPSVALRALEISLREERKALGIDLDKVEVTNEPAFMKTRFAEQAKKATPDELIKMLQEMSQFKPTNNLY